MFALRRLALDPLHEPAQRELMRLYAWAGQPAAALRQYEECVRILEHELSLLPEAETTDLFEAIRSKRFPAQAAASTASASASTSTPRRDQVALTRSPAPLRPQTHYVASGEAHIAYQVIGAGPVDIVIVVGFVSHLEQIWEEPGLVEFLRRLSAAARVILFDKRGVGLSDRVGYPPTLENTMDDLLAVLDAVGARCPVLFGVSEGGPNSILFAATYPQRLAALILYGTAAKFTRVPDYPWALTGEQFDRWLERLVAGWGGSVGLEYFAPTRAQDTDFQEWWARMLRLGSSPGSVKAVLGIARDIDIRPVVPAIRVPTLVLHRTGDRMMRVEGGRYLAQRIPGATYVELAGDDHWWWVGETDSLFARITAFLDEINQPPTVTLSPRTDWVLATLVLAEFASEQGTGDSNEQALHEQVRALVQREVAHYRGREVSWRGNRVLAAFDGPSRAIHCVVAIRAAVRERNVSVRAGVHTGECVFSDDEISGVAIQIAAGVLSKAESAEVLVSSTVKELVLGSGFEFEARGSRIIAGTSGEWHLFALRSTSYSNLQTS
jgi:pimeloyl-ACP methyl ester carboxylesterase